MGIYIFFGLVIAVFQVILFIKIWEMTNNVKTIKNNFDDYDPYAIYAKTFAMHEAKRFLMSRPKVDEIFGENKEKIVCTLTPDNYYEVVAEWTLSIKRNPNNESEGTYNGVFKTTVCISCTNCSSPLSPESWVLVQEPTAVAAQHTGLW